jgi:hypothetical protein
MNRTAWLIEAPQATFAVTRWLQIRERAGHDRGLDGKLYYTYWTDDANEASQFSRRRDAEAIIRVFESECLLCIATEHVFIEPDIPLTK